MKSASGKVLAVIFATLFLFTGKIMAQEGSDGIFGATATGVTTLASQSKPVPLSGINYTRIDKAPRTLQSDLLTVKWLGDGEVEISVKEGYSIGFHLSLYTYPAGTVVQSDGQPWETQIFKEDAKFLFNGGETRTLKVNLPSGGEPVQVDLYTYRLKDGSWAPDVVKNPPHHGPNFGEDRKLHSARILGTNFKAEIESKYGILIKDDDSQWTEAQLGEALRVLDTLPRSFITCTKEIHRVKYGWKGEKDVYGYIIIGKPVIYICDLACNLRHLNHTLVHEMTHCFQDGHKDVFDAWKGQFWPGGRQASPSVSQYGNSKDAEDMAESVAEYQTNGAKMKEAFPDRYEFIKQRVMEGKEFL